MTIDEEAGGPEDIGDGDDGSGCRTPDNNAASMICASIDHTAPNSCEEPAAAAAVVSYVYRIDDDASGLCEAEGNPLLAEIDRQRAAVVIDSSIGKSKRTDKSVEAQMACAMDKTQNRMQGPDGISVNAPTTEAIGPPDGGLRAWMIMIGSFAINGVLFSIINTYSLIYLELQTRLTEAGESDVSSKAGKILHGGSRVRDYRRLS